MAVIFKVGDSWCQMDQLDRIEMINKTFTLHHEGYIRIANPGHVCRLLHRELVEAKEGDIVDHINGNKTDNRRCNLRISNHKQNCRNRRHSKGAYRLKSGRWQAKIRFEYKQVSLGTFATYKEAKAVYTRAMLANVRKSK